MLKLKLTLILGAALLTTGSAPAATLLYDFTAGSGGSAFAGFGGNWGFNFTITSPTIVGSFGLWDEGANGLAAAHQVGVFNSGGGSAISSAIVDNTSYVVPSANAAGQWLFTDLAVPITLNPGTYTLGFFNPGGADPFRGGGVTTSYMAGASYVIGKARSGAAAFAWPDANSGAGGGWAGPNFGVGVPEPAGAALAGVAALGLVRRRRA